VNVDGRTWSLYRYAGSRPRRGAPRAEGGRVGPHVEVPGRRYAESERGLIDVSYLDAYLADYGRGEDLYAYLGQDGLTAATLGHALCQVFASRDTYRQRVQDLERELVDLRQEVGAQRLHTNMAVQSLQLFTAELTAVTGRLSRGRGMPWEGACEGRGRGDEGEWGGDN
jgi:hypothetical protein